MQFNELSQDSLNAELDYRREQLRGSARTTGGGRPHARRLRLRRTGRTAYHRLVA
jgi:hypothetical protein